MIGWFDAEAGASGDMMLAALVSAGVPLDVPQAAIDALDIGVTLRAEQVQRGSLGSLKVHVDVPETRTVRHLPDILAMFKALPANVAELAGAVFTKLGEAEEQGYKIAPKAGEKPKAKAASKAESKPKAKAEADSVS